MLRAALLISALLASCVCRKKDAGQGEAAKALAAIVATCAGSNGEVDVRRPKQPYWDDVNIGAVFRAGDWLRTGAKSFTRVEFLTGGGLELEEKAMVVIDAAPPRGDAGERAAPALVAVESGVVRGFMEPPSEGKEAAPLIIRTEDGSEVQLLAKEGGETLKYRLTRGEGGGTEVAITEGEATLVASGAARSLRAGQAAHVEKGKVTEEVQLIDFPQSSEPGIDARFRFEEKLTVRISWHEVSGASGYRLQVATDLSFQALQLSLDTEATSLMFPVASQGTYVWRVAAKDAAGRWGEFGFARRIFLEKEEPRDLLLGPEDAAIVTYSTPPSKVTFSWQSAPNASAYRLVVAKSPDLLRRPVVSRPSPEQHLELLGLEAGDYFWGAYAEGDSRTPIFLEPRRLSVRKVAKAKIKTPKAINKWGP